MVGTQTQTRPVVIATAAALTLSAFLWEQDAVVIENEETNNMPRLENKISSRIAEINGEFMAGQELSQIKILNEFVQKLIKNTRDIDSGIVNIINKNFWDLF